ncbi:unnamed protein product [Didymodactylos carnosus]|uniref:Uncharacterized protein n=1 Tax=Didymodactylos carnosus TaxID=1234261 RepID=A0A814JPK2_9BILA|nr:unnamed protein product [Didymodactylos carnosus]CAF1104049.1 unnamed protein product [Didymodactylos carnosus]CAF3810565.1 unnamed protein product [Didymodactylos carnosus]CAF3866062.1 unnamed protein product [Didymodactylos carnosus]
METQIGIIPGQNRGTVDMELFNETIAMLSTGSSDEKQKHIEKIVTSPGDYIPRVFYYLSNILYKQEKKEQAYFWYYFGQMRAKYDSMRCVDVLASRAHDLLNMQFEPLIIQDMFSDLDVIEQILEKVIELNDSTPYNYDYHWINVYGLDSICSRLFDDHDDNRKKPSLSVPKEEWNEIRESVREFYLSELQEIRKMKHEQPENTNYPIAQAQSDKILEALTSLSLDSYSCDEESQTINHTNSVWL